MESSPGSTVDEGTAPIPQHVVIRTCWETLRLAAVSKARWLCVIGGFAAVVACTSTCDATSGFLKVNSTHRAVQHLITTKAGVPGRGMLEPLLLLLPLVCPPSPCHVLCGCNCGLSDMSGVVSGQDPCVWGPQKGSDNRAAELVLMHQAAEWAGCRFSR